MKTKILLCVLCLLLLAVHVSAANAELVYSAYKGWALFHPNCYNSNGFRVGKTTSFGIGKMIFQKTSLSLDVCWSRYPYIDPKYPFAPCMIRNSSTGDDSHQIGFDLNFRYVPERLTGPKFPRMIAKCGIGTAFYYKGEVQHTWNNVNYIPEGEWEPVGRWETEIDEAEWKPLVLTANAGLGLQWRLWQHLYFFNETTLHFRLTELNLDDYNQQLLDMTFVFGVSFY
ncbi:MAG: hypothetical protein P9X24_09425 [Candidatus Hatepunaea meridiana]|nr:hypothetical protein [Candidatus Hatepunaea meridiana]